MCVISYNTYDITYPLVNVCILYVNVFVIFCFRKLRTDVKRMRVKGVIKAGDDPRKTCARCREPFGWLFNKGSICPKCRHKICDKCRRNVSKISSSWVCVLCYKQKYDLLGYLAFVFPVCWATYFVTYATFVYATLTSIHYTLPYLVVGLASNVIYWYCILRVAFIVLPPVENKTCEHPVAAILKRVLVVLRTFPLWQIHYFPKPGITNQSYDFIERSVIFCYQMLAAS